jgi:hypothetical protein
MSLQRRIGPKFRGSVGDTFNVAYAWSRGLTALDKSQVASSVPGSKGAQRAMRELTTSGYRQLRCPVVRTAVDGGCGPHPLRSVE